MRMEGERPPRRMFQAITVETIDTGRRLLRLTRPWMGLDVGTEVAALGHGGRATTGRTERVVLVVTGNRAGEVVRGPA
jgi:hypothetical protein